MLLNTQRYLKTFLQLMITVAILLCISAYSLAQTQPRLINFQGKLTDQQGQVLDGTYTIIFALYATPTGGTALWTEPHENLSISKQNEKGTDLFFYRLTSAGSRRTLASYL